MRGFWHTVDAVLACVILMGFLVMMTRAGTVLPENLESRAYNILRGLDEQGVLGDYAAAMDYAGLDSHVNVYSHSHSVRICDYSGSCAGPVPSAKNIYTGNYLIAGNDSYHPYTVKLYMWSE